MVKSKKQMFMIIGVFALILILGTTTYAFFNYTRTGGANTFSVGRIYFTTNQTETINLTNAFPIERSAIDTDTDNVDEVVIEIEGDTDYSEGIEYLVSSVDSSIYTSTGKLVPISLDVTVTDLGTASPTYFTARESTNTSVYKKLVGDSLVGDQMLLVGYIAPNATLGTASGIDGSITIKAFFDKDVIAISDTYDGNETDNMGTTNDWADGRTILTTTEWNSLSSTGISFKIKVEANEGIWVNQPLDDIVRVKNLDTTTYQPIMDNVSSTYVSASTGIDFGAISSDTNGKGVYMHAGTENDAYPILYYRGAVTDNNVIFANQCWKMVRTTETGGVKLIYNGKPQTSDIVVSATEVTNVGFTYDSSDNSWNTTITSSSVSSSNPNEFSFTIPEGNAYQLELTGTTPSQGGVIGAVMRNGAQENGFGGGGSSPISLTHELGGVFAGDVIKVTYYISGGNASSSDPATLKIKILKPDLSLAVSCDNTGAQTRSISNSSDTFAFSNTTLYNSPAYVGYMWGSNVYEIKQKNTSASYKYGSKYIYNNGTYTLIDSDYGVSDTKHYTCFTTSDSCSGKIYYVYYKMGNYYYYIELQDGKTVEDAFEEMQENEVSSSVKYAVDGWYWKNMRTYTNNLEDTIWCNDRSFGNNNNNGFISNGGSTSIALYYGPKERSNQADNLSQVKNQPILYCKNKNDRFTVNNGNGNKALNYPAALLTIDEIALAGGIMGDSSNYYLNNSAVQFWTLSPYWFYINHAAGIVAHDSPYNMNVETEIGVRPSISVKPGQQVVGGTGTVSDPYIIE